MREATKHLRESIDRGEVVESKFSEQALKDIRAGKSKIDGWTWHHHQERGRMQLIPKDVHAQAGHVGGFDLWFGAAE